MRLAIIILNYRTPTLVIDCLNSLQSQVNVTCDKAVVVDNDSRDGSVEYIGQAIVQQGWQSWVQILPSGINGGFSAGNNLGIEAIQAEAYLLLNSDTIVRPGALESLLDALHKFPDAGIISPRLEWPDGSPQNSCFNDHSPLSELIKSSKTGLVTRLLKAYNVPIVATDESIEPQWTSFACVLIKREVIDQIGLMDAGYFMYFDDVDYCRRAREVGWRIRYWPQAKVVHLRGGSSPVKEELKLLKRPRSYLYASRSRYYAKFYGKIGLIRANFYWYLGRSISMIREILGSKKPHTCEKESQDIWINWNNSLKSKFLSTKSI